MKWVNEECDYHMHSLNYSDGLNTVDELVQFAGFIGLKEIAITDHSEAEGKFQKRAKRSSRSACKRFENVHNDVVVKFGIEMDLIDKKGDISASIYGYDFADIRILSAHKGVYCNNPKTITQGYLKAIELYGKSIDIIGHLDVKDFAEFVDAEKVIQAANEKGIIVEINAKNILSDKSDLKITKLILDKAEKVMLNSDAHCLADLKNRDKVKDLLKDKGLL